MFENFDQILLTVTLILLKQEKLEGGLYPDGLIIGWIFLSPCRWAYNQVGL